MRFKAAPWDGNVSLFSILAISWGTVLFVTAVFFGVYGLPLLDITDWFFWIVLVCLLSLGLTGLIRLLGVVVMPVSYEIDRNELVVRRVLARILRFPLKSFERVEDAAGRFKPCKQKLQTADIGKTGNTGTFGYRGFYTSGAWQEFEAYATSRKTSIILLGKDNLLISPRDPQAFIRYISPRLGTGKSAKNRSVKRKQTP
ncbi:hypothetical protein JXM67_06130 [candidate division WOR-3 bacterium]|nr:hypothetical protein [candidate division WOR-3 bacterium]